jgi:hypothetical protein
MTHEGNPGSELPERPSEVVAEGERFPGDPVLLDGQAIHRRVDRYLLEAQTALLQNTDGPEFREAS